MSFIFRDELRPVFGENVSAIEKCKNLIDTGMKDMPVGAISGIGVVYEEKLRSHGIYFAYNLLGQFLILNKDKDAFRDWMLTTIGMTEKHIDTCIKCLQVYCEKNRI
jgi:hypothetical protein